MVQSRELSVSRDSRFLFEFRCLFFSSSFRNHNPTVRIVLELKARSRDLTIRVAFCYATIESHHKADFETKRPTPVVNRASMNRLLPLWFGAFHIRATDLFILIPSLMTCRAMCIGCECTYRARLLCSRLYHFITLFPYPRPRRQCL